MRFAAILLSAALLAGGNTEAPPAPTGRWQVASITVNGEPRRDEEISDSIWSFDPPRLVIRDTAYDFRVENGYLEIKKPSGEQGWMKYELSGGRLRVAFFDGLTGKPASFEAEPGRRDPALVVVNLVPVR